MVYQLYRPRWPALFILLVILGLVFAGCQENTEIPWATVSAPIVENTPKITDTPLKALPPTHTPQITASVSPTEPVAFRGKSIEFWHSWQGDLAKQAEEAVKEFNRTNTYGLTVKVRSFYSGGALDDAFLASLKNQAEDMPQIIAAPGDQLALWSEKFGALADLNGLVDDQEYGLSDAEKNSFYKAFWEQDKVGEKRIGIPALRTARIIFYNETWAKELGFLNSPKTPEEFKKQACAAAKKNNTSGYQEKYGTGGWLIDNDSLTTLSWLAAFGAKPIPDTEQKPYTFQSSEAGSALTFLRKMLDDGCAWLPRTPAPYEYFGKRLALFYAGTLPDAYIQARWQEKLKSMDRWRVIPFMDENGSPIVYSSGYSYAIPKSKPETELAAWLFLRYLESPEVAGKLTRALPSLPVNSGAAEQLSDLKGAFPWSDLLDLTGNARAAPTYASWVDGHRLLEDAAWQVYKGPAEQVLQILPELDQAIQDIAANRFK
jgi:multiple sugar transport system substrate-binding protein